MDPLIRDTMFVGLSLRDIAEALVFELRRRNCYGCFYAPPGGPDPKMGTFSSSMPEGTAQLELQPEEQLRIFAEVASMGVQQNRMVIPGETSPNTRKPN